LIGIRSASEAITAKSNSNNKHFDHICYSADGDYILAGGNSKYVFLYELRHRLLLKRFGLSKNRSLAVTDKLNSKFIVEGEDVGQIEEESEDSDGEERKDDVIPGAKRPDHSLRKLQLKLECRMVKFSPNGATWSAATTEGLQVFGPPPEAA
jgi:periodic tryptophan protein 2